MPPYIIILLISLFINTNKINGISLRGSNINCMTPESILHGKVTITDTRVGSIVFYSCDTGYELKGHSSRTCLSTGWWSFSTPTCRVIYLASKDNSYKNHDAGYIFLSG